LQTKLKNYFGYALALQLTIVGLAPGIDVMIFAEKYSKKLAFLTQNKATLCKKSIITLVFEKNANFFAENFQKSPKIVIITSVPGS
jgi:hypothetical protein